MTYQPKISLMNWPTNHRTGFKIRLADWLTSHKLIEELLSSKVTFKALYFARILTYKLKNNNSYRVLSVTKDLFYQKQLCCSNPNCLLTYLCTFSYRLKLNMSLKSNLFLLTAIYVKFTFSLWPYSTGVWRVFQK